MRVVGRGSKLESLKLHRTKCTRLITAVIAPCMLAELVSDVGEQGFSLIIDESTDVSVMKFMAIMIRYYSEAQNEIITDFLGFVEVYRATAVALFESLREFLQKIGLDYKRVIGLGSDGASNLVGIHNSVFALFKAEVRFSIAQNNLLKRCPTIPFMTIFLIVQIPDIVLVRCVCHSLHGAASKAAAHMPADLEFLVRETRNWFAKSPLKKQQYKDLFAAINDGDMPAALVQLVRTRWLAWARAIEVVVKQWLELKTHFQNHCLANSPDEKSAIGRKLRDCYSDANYLLLLFLLPITTRVNAVNSLFQATNAEVIFHYLPFPCISSVARIDPYFWHPGLLAV